MRIGTALTFLVASWILLGYLLSDNFNTHKALSISERQLTQALHARDAIQKQLDEAAASLAVLRQQNAGLIEAQDQLALQIRQLQTENEGLRAQNLGLMVELDRGRQVYEIAGAVASLMPDTALLAILPASLGVSLLLYRRGRQLWNARRRKESRSKTISMLVTEREMREILQKRRAGMNKN